MLKASEPFSPLISMELWLRRPRAKREASSVPRAPLAKVTVATNASSTVTGCLPPCGVSRSLMNVVVMRADGGRLADEEARQIDDVRAEVADGAGARLPSRRGARSCGSRVGEPVLQVARAEMIDATQAPFLDDLAHQADQRGRSGS